MKGGEFNLIRGDEVKTDVNGTYRVGTVQFLQYKKMPDNTLKNTHYKLKFEDNSISGWIPEAEVFKLASNIPPVPSASGQGRRKSRKHKRSKRRKTLKR